jgi:lipopolysaccharide transport system permease protein
MIPDAISPEDSRRLVSPVAAAPMAEPRPVPLIVILPRAPFWRLNLAEVWDYRELLFFMTWRDLKVRYRQTVLGAMWAVLQPLIAMAIFTVVFGIFADMPSDGVPYPLFTFAALLPWNVFATALTRMTGSIVANQHVLTKVYFPRVLAPLSGLGSAVVDFGFSFVVLLVLMGVFGVAPTWRLIAVPLLLVVALAAALGVGLWFAALNVRYRDMAYVVPFLAQIWLYASPVAYSSRVVPEEWHWLYALNPMVGVIEGFRWALLGTPWAPGGLLLISSVVIVLAAVSGLAYFQRTEDTFADIV